MSKNVSRREFLRKAGTGALGLAALSVIPAAVTAEESLYTPGTYAASAKGYGGEVTVSVTFDANKILDIQIDAASETPAIGQAAAAKLAEQVIAAQSSAIDGVTGATMTSKAVKAAVAECIKQASGGKIIEGGDVSVKEEIVVGSDTDWLGTAPEISESEITETTETEILVVGAGNAGLMAAARASSHGAKVIVIEKGISSTTERHWIGAVGTTAAKEAGVEVDKNKLVAELCKYASHRCDERLIRLWANHSGEAIDWYHEVVRQYHPDVKLHMEWDLGAGDHDTYYAPATMHNFQDDIPEHDYSSATASYGLDSLSKLILEKGNEIRYEHAMVKLEKDEAGKVSSAIVKRTDGSHIRIKAVKGIVLATGGYVCDKQMFATLNPEAYMSCLGSDATALDTGDGIRAAMWLGAAKDADATAMIFDRGSTVPFGGIDGDWSKSGYFHLGSQPWLKVNLNGERFCNESVPYDFIVHAASLEPQRMYNTIYDSNWMEHIAKFQQIGCARIIPSKSGGKLHIFSPEAEMGLLAALEAGGIIQKADTFEELAQKLNMPVDAFTATVTRYNELCAKGVDEDFGKEAYRMVALDTPPYYGVRQAGTVLCTLDGLRINTKMQVLDTNSNVIDGLYAAGDCSGGFFAHNYPEYIVGVAIGRTLTEAYLVGDALGKA